MSGSRMRVGLVSFTLCAALTGCGSMVASEGRTVTGAPGTEGSGQALGNGLSVGAVGGSADPTGQDGSVVGGANASGSGGAGGTVGSAQAAPDGSSAGDPAVGAAGGTVRSNAVDAIKVGFTYPDTAAIAAVFGRDSSEADPKAWAQKFFDYINKTGGVSGRKLAPIYFKSDVAEDQSTMGQRACTAFTQDTRVDIVINTGVIGDTFAACLGRAGVSVIETDEFMTDGQDASRLRNKFSPVAMRADRLYRAIVDLSAQRGLLPKGSVVGVLVEDCAWGNRVFQQHVTPAAQRNGARVVKGTHRCVQNIVSDLGPVTNDVQREALRFATEGVTHVVFLSSAEAFVLSRFTEQASDQRYFPKYLVSSNANAYNNSNPDAIIRISEDALPNVHGLGFLPMLDVGELARPEGAAQKAAQDRCRAADPNEGPTAIEDDRRAKYFNRNSFYGYCDAFFVLKATLEANGVRFGLADVTRGYQSALSGRMASATLAGGSFRVTSGRLDGAGLARPFAFDAKRKLFAYDGGALQVS